MFKNKIIASVAVLAAIIMLTFPLKAQPPMGEGMSHGMKGGPGMKGGGVMNCLPQQAKDDLHEAIKEYKNQNICPQFSAWKTKIDATLSPDDLSKLNALRDQAAKLKEQRDSNRAQMRAKMQAGEISRSDLKDMREEMRSSMKDILEQLKPIAENNQDLLKSIGEEAKTKGESWRSDIKGIFKAWEQKYADDLKNCPNFKNRDHFRMDGMRKNIRKRFMIAVMLYNGNCDEMNRFGEEQMMNGTSDNEGITVTNYPNPFTASTTIKFNLPVENYITLTVESGSGEIIATLFTGKLAAGEHAYNYVPSANLAPGAYFYKLQGDGFKESGKMLLQK